MAKTKWTIEPNTLTIYPKRNIRIIGLIVFILFAAFIFFLSRSSQMHSTGLSFSYYVALLLIPLFFLFIAETKVIFNGTDRMLYRKIGFLPVGSIPFDDIAIVQPYETIGSGFNYMLFRKSNRHGKGIMISNGYSKSTNPNLIQFQQEVLPKIDELVFANAPAIQKSAIYDFKFFKEENGVYKLRERKIIGLFIGILLIALSVYLLLKPGLMQNESVIKSFIIAVFPMIIGGVFIFSFFTSLSFDKVQKKIIRSTFAGRVVKEYPFDDLVRFRIIRKTTNFIYSGTEVSAEIFVPSKNKTITILLKNFTGTKKIERFLDEANTILGRI